MYGVLVAGQYAVFDESKVLVEVEFGRLAEYLQQPDHDHDTYDQVQNGEYFVQVTVRLLVRVSRHVVAKTNGAKRNEAVVESVQIGPVLDVSVDGRRNEKQKN